MVQRGSAGRFIGVAKTGIPIPGDESSALGWRGFTRADSSPRVGVASRVSVAMSKMTEKAALLPPVQG